MRHPDDHAQVVSAVAAEIHARVSRGESVHISKGGVHHFVPLPGDRRFQGSAIDISRLNRVLEIDIVNRRCVAEPGVTFANLVRTTLQKGLLPTVVPELEGITVGGAVAGCSVESMSYRYGGFHDGCLEYQIISGTGEVITCSPTQDALLFNMIHGSYGTLGVLTRLTFRLISAEPFVHLTYQHFDEPAAFEHAMRERIHAADHDFIDGIVHGARHYVLCLGHFAKTAPYTSDYRWLNIYYKSTAHRREDYLTTFDYCFRYDTECHWLTKTLPPLEWKPVRFAVGKWVLGSTNLIRWSTILAPVLGLRKRPDVVVDVFIPMRRFGEFLRWYNQDYAFYPLWIVPYRIAEPYPWISPEHAGRFRDELFIDCAVYGKPNNHPTIDDSAVLEQKTYELDGIKTLISCNHHTREQFWGIYNQNNYEQTKARLDPQGIFPGLYEKFHRT